MNKFFHLTPLLIVVYIICNLLISCANIGSIDGGKKDSLPPVMVGSKPLYLDTNYNDDRVYILFNEFFSLKDINQEFYSSPPFEEIPDFKIRKRGLLIKLKEPLKDSVTYTFNFGNGIVDFNEGNLLEKFRFVFSTKSNIDSFSIGGNLRNAIDQSAPEKSLVMVFKDNTDSIPFKSLPDYLSRTDSSGNFSIDFIRPGSYKVFAVSDKNSNQLADFFESRAFLDSLIIPKRAVFVSFDTLKAGTILHDTINNITDSLENDSIIVNRRFVTNPSNLRLYLFAENNQAQKILDYTRKERSKVDISFALPLTPDFKINPINFKADPSDIIVEKNPANDTITWWITNPQIQAMDSLEVNVLYLSKDSIGKPVQENDTLLFEFREKKKDDAWKRKSKDEKIVKKEYLSINYLVKEGKVDLNNPLRAESPTPLSVVDTSKIRLFEIIDTSVIDTKEQKIIKAFRLQKDLLTFKFKRPIVEEFFLYPINFKAENWYTTASNDSNRLFTCQITNAEVAMMDTLKLMVDYDNNFFMKQVQVLSDTVILPLSKQKILSRKRNEADKITLVFDKPINSSIRLVPSDFTAGANWYQIANNSARDTVTINISDKNVSNKDTLTFSVNSFDYIGLKNDSVYFNETMRSTFKEREQFLVGAGRIKKGEITLFFNKKTIDNPLLEPFGFSANQPWYRLEKNNQGDTLTYQISDESVSAKDTLSLLVKYTDSNRRGKITDYVDTLMFTGTQILQLKKRTESGQAVKPADKAQIVHIYLPTDYKLESDTLHIRHRLLTKKWKEKSKYMLRLDSLSFIDVFNIYNKAEDFEFATQPTGYYATIHLNLKNIKPSVQALLSQNLQDSTKRDSSLLSQFSVPQKEIDNYAGDGKIIVQLLGEKNILVKDYLISKDQIIKMDFLSPGKYTIRIIFDKNDNGQWDTGDYFKHIQPERVITNGEEVILKSGVELEYEWNVGESLIKSFTKSQLKN